MTGAAHRLAWVEVAEQLQTSRENLLRWRERFADAPRKRDVARWEAFMRGLGLGPYSLRNAVPARDEDAPPSEGASEERAIRLRREKFQLEKAEYELKCAKDQTVPISHVQAALGQMLAKFRQALDGLPGRIATGIDEADQAQLLKLLTNAEKDKLPYKKLRAMIEKGHVRPFADVHARREFVASEIDSVRRVLVKCEYLQADPDADAED